MVFVPVDGFIVEEGLASYELVAVIFALVGASFRTKIKQDFKVPLWNGALWTLLFTGSF
jgi:hypothetical protein